MKYIAWVVEFILRNAAGLGLLIALGGIGAALKNCGHSAWSLLRSALVGLSLAWMAVLLFLFDDHLRFPLFLDLMEGVVFQHVDRLTSLQAVYSSPTPEYVPLAYNAGFYVLAVPFTWVFGLSLSTLRFVAILATIGIGVLIFRVLRQATGSSTWGLFGSGLFAACYQGPSGATGAAAGAGPRIPRGAAPRRASAERATGRGALDDGLQSRHTCVSHERSRH